MIGLETALGLVLQAGRREGADAAALIRQLTVGAARCSGCPAARCERGAPADVTVLDRRRCLHGRPARSSARSRATRRSAAGSCAGA